MGGVIILTRGMGERLTYGIPARYRVVLVERLSKQTLGGEWSRPFCSRPRVRSSKGLKPVVMRGPERVLP